MSASLEQVMDLCRCSYNRGARDALSEFAEALEAAERPDIARLARICLDDWESGDRS